MNFYKILSESETPVKKYRELCLVHHPDKGGKADDFRALRDAFEKIIEETAGREKDNEETKSAGFKTHTRTHRGWNWMFGEEFDTGIPVFQNYFTNREYQGSNIFRLWAYREHDKDVFFATYKQCQDYGVQIRKGAKGIPVFYFDRKKVKDKKTGEDKMIFIAKCYFVFGASQMIYETVPAVIQKRIEYCRPLIAAA